MKEIIHNGVTHHISIKTDKNDLSHAGTVVKVDVSPDHESVTQLGYYSCLAFEFHYWGFRSCGCTHLASLNDTYAATPLELISLFFASWDAIFEDEFQYIDSQQFMFSISQAQQEAPTPLVKWLLLQENCKPVHTYRNQAHWPYQQMTVYAWHPKGLGLPEKWGMDVVPVLPEQRDE